VNALKRHWWARNACDVFAVLQQPLSDEVAFGGGISGPFTNLSVVLGSMWQNTSVFDLGVLEVLSAIIHGGIERSVCSALGEVSCGV
jgi:hypothetical protein